MRDGESKKCVELDVGMVFGYWVNGMGDVGIKSFLEREGGL